MKGLITALHDVSAELKGIRNILASMWHSRYFSEETDQVSPEVYADEYISTEECAKRLNISDQTSGIGFYREEKSKNRLETGSSLYCYPR